MGKAGRRRKQAREAAVKSVERRKANQIQSSSHDESAKCSNAWTPHRSSSPASSGSSRNDEAPAVNGDCDEDEDDVKDDYLGHEDVLHIRPSDMDIVKFWERSGMVWKTGADELIRRRYGGLEVNGRTIANQLVKQFKEQEREKKSALNHVPDEFFIIISNQRMKSSLIKWKSFLSRVSSTGLQTPCA